MRRATLEGGAAGRVVMELTLAHASARLHSTEHVSVGQPSIRVQLGLLRPELQAATDYTVSCTFGVTIQADTTSSMETLAWSAGRLFSSIVADLHWEQKSGNVHDEHQFMEALGKGTPSEARCWLALSVACLDTAISRYRGCPPRCT
eukprot:COSAG04_NODE_11544_length_703_cov_1.071192_1_plen_146_part_01